jgi:hypothetical protein
MDLQKKQLYGAFSAKRRLPSGVGDLALDHVREALNLPSLSVDQVRHKSKSAGIRGVDIWIGVVATEFDRLWEYETQDVLPITSGDIPTTSTKKRRSWNTAARSSKRPRMTETMPKELSARSDVCDSGDPGCSTSHVAGSINGGNDEKPSGDCYDDPERDLEDIVIGDAGSGRSDDGDSGSEDLRTISVTLRQVLRSDLDDYYETIAKILEESQDTITSLMGDVALTGHKVVFKVIILMSLLAKPRYSVIEV